MALTDWQRVDDLAREIGADAVVEVVTMFLEETDEVMARLAGSGSGAESGAAAPTTDDYHFLKGSALNLGLTELASLCELGEQETKAGVLNGTTRAAVMALYPASRADLVAGIATRFEGQG